MVEEPAVELVNEVHAGSGCAGAKGYKRLRLDESGATVRGGPNFTNFVHVARGKLKFGYKFGRATGWCLARKGGDRRSQSMA